MSGTTVESGVLSFSIQSRVLRELGERLVKQPEVAVLELVKNSYDADATHCTVTTMASPGRLTIADDGSGMTLARFASAWMTIGTAAKAGAAASAKYKRPLTGEKGIGRFAVRFLGGKLRLTTVAWDAERDAKTRLAVNFDWRRFDLAEDVGKILVRYVLTRQPAETPTGTTLAITHLRGTPQPIDWKQVSTGAAAVVSGLPAAMVRQGGEQAGGTGDPGFRLVLANDGEEEDLSEAIRSHFVLRAEVDLRDQEADITIHRNDGGRPYLAIRTPFENAIAPVWADLRFFPRRAGTFKGAPVDGRAAYTWLRDNSGVLVFDQGFQMRPYGTKGDDWLGTDADANRNQRDPRSSLTSERYAMTKEERAAPAENWMLRLPESAQLMGAVHVRSARGGGRSDGLVAAADREGFLDNAAFRQLRDLIRGAVEAIAYADRQIQRQRDADRAARLVEEGRAKTTAAIADIEADDGLDGRQKTRIVTMLMESQQRVEAHEAGARERERQLEIMSLLGVIGGFMTHEFGAAGNVLRQASAELTALARDMPAFEERATSLRRHGEALKAFVEYSAAYIKGARVVPTRPYPAAPRLRQIKRVFKQYTSERGIEVDIEVDGDVMVPLIPAALYNGVAQNLFTNSLKAVVAKTYAPGGDRRIAFRAWNDDKHHRLQVSDTGIGIPMAVRDYVFDPLFTTTEDPADPLGSGMGLGLALVKRGAKAFGGDASIAPTPPGFSTCVEVRFPLAEAVPA